MSASLPLFDRVFSGTPEPRKKEPRSDDQQSAIEAKREAIKQVERNANPEFLIKFREALERVAKDQSRFTSDAVWERYEQYSPCPSQHEPRAAGAVVVGAIRDKVIVKVANLFWNSTRAVCHNRPKQVYQSLICKRGGEMK